MALPEDLKIPVDRFPEKVARFVLPEAPGPLKMMAARGMVPMQPVVQVCVLHNFAHDADEQLAQTARQTLKNMPRGTVQQVVSQPLLPVVLHSLAQQFSDDPVVIRHIVQNARTDEDTLVQLAKKADEALCETLARNEARILQSPRLVEALYFNRKLRASTCDRMIDLCVRNGMDLSHIPGHEEIVAAIQGIELPTTEAEEQAQDALFLGLGAQTGAPAEVPPEDFEAQPFESQPPQGQTPEAAEAADDAEPESGRKRGSAAGRIRKMNAAQKVRLANLGTASERAILIQDSNRVVARAVIRSPAISDAEAIAYAKNRALSEEVILYISKQRRWTRHYQMRLNLISHPKCPISDALNYLKTLRAGDLRAVARSKNVSPVVAKAANDLIKMRMK